MSDRLQSPAVSTRDLGLALAQRRLALGLSVGARGRLVGLFHSTISKIERSTYRPTLAIIRRIGEALGYNMD
jgi:transcriptional regulator with XRE-family HTH domain